ncbi:hypothetical protein [Streptomyces sp. SAS_260]|uniref:hypothetical protein n=1 Tax=Streptomyces sp. SAS_260 TaxID=3412751 RepID=UPI00403C42F7
MREEMTVENPFRNDGPMDKAIPWISALLAVALAVAAATSGIGSIIKAIAVLACASILARAVYLIVRRRRTSQ